MLLWKIAWRNVWRHHGRSLIIGAILFLGALLMTLSNAVINGAQQGFAENWANRLTGHLIIIAAQEDTQAIFFMENIQPLGLLPDYPRLKEVLAQQAFIAGFLPMSRGFAMILDETGAVQFDVEMDRSAVLLFGIEFAAYQRVFQQNFTAIEGELLQPGEPGVLITEEDRQRIYTRNNIWVIPQGGRLVEEYLPSELRPLQDRLTLKQELVFLGLSGDSLEADIRLPVTGIVRLHSLNKVWLGSFMDIESFRTCFGYVTASSKAATLTERQTQLLASEHEDDIFADDNPVEDLGTDTPRYDVASMQAQTARTVNAVNPDEGAYQFVTVKLQPGIRLEDGADRLRQALSDAGLNVKVLTWEQASGSIQDLAALLQGIVFVFVLILFFVAAIVITNTLSMTAIERVSELATIRAIGGRQWFVRRMFLAEISLLSIIFGGLGIMGGILLTWGLAALRISATTHWMVTFLAGGDTFQPIITLAGLGIGIGQLAVTTLLAAIYPMIIAGKISPLDAIARD